MQAEDSYDVLETFNAQGKIKHWGVSVNTIAECDHVLENGHAAVMQMEYNLLEQSPTSVFAKADAEIGVISRVPLK